jgi:hypothetical protein
MPANLWTAPAGPLIDGVSIAKNTFTSYAPLLLGSAGGIQPRVSQLQPGSRLSVYAWGVASNTGTPTLVLGVYYGAVGAVDLAISAAKTTTTAMSNWVWELWYDGRVVGNGTTGTIIGHGRWRVPTSLTAWTEFNLPETAPAAVTIDTSIAKNVGIGAAWSASSASNTITLHDLRVEVHG